MKRFIETQLAHVAWRIAARSAVVTLLVAAGLFAAESSAFAETDSFTAGGLSSAVVATALPGLVQSPPGALNGPLNQSNLQYFGGTDGVLGKTLSNGDAAGFVRTWTRQPPNGDVVVVLGYEVRNAAEIDLALSGTNAAEKLDAAGTFPVPGVPSGAGYTLHASAAGVPATQYMVAFGKGNVLFVVLVETTSGDLSSADAVSLANAQFARAPNSPLPGVSGTQLDWSRIALLAGGVLLTIAMFVIGRTRKYPAALSRYPSQDSQNWPPPVVAPAGPGGAHSYAAATGTRAKASAEQWQ